MPSCRAASILAWPAIRPPSSPTSAGVVQFPTASRARARAPREGKCWRELKAQQLRVPPRPGDRQLIVGQDVRPLLRLAPARGHHHRDLGDAELPGREYPRVARNQTVVLALGKVAAKEVYAALDWLGREQPFIEATLARRHLKDGALPLYDSRPRWPAAT
jgi:hypothetical protein